MSILIDPDRCRGCGSCVEACPGNLIRQDSSHHAVIRYPEECWGCTSCLKECRFGAISYFLGADIGGQGGRMYTEEDGNLRRWIVKQPGAEPIVIIVDKRDANQY